MVLVDEDHISDTEDNKEKEDAEGNNKDSKTSEKSELKTETDVPPTELERLKVFTQKVARCAAKSFCETYVRPLVIKNPNPMPSKSETVNIISHKQEVLTPTIINPTEDKDQTAIIPNPEQENEEEVVYSVQNQRREAQEENDRQGAVVNPNRREHPIAATVNLLQEKQMITVDKGKPSLSFDIANILSYLPCQSLIASCDQKDEKNREVSLHLESKSAEISEIADVKCSESQSCKFQNRSKTEHRERKDYEEASPFPEEEL